MVELSVSMLPCISMVFLIKKSLNLMAKFSSEEQLGRMNYPFLWPACLWSWTDISLLFCLSSTFFLILSVDDTCHDTDSGTADGGSSAFFVYIIIQLSITLDLLAWARLCTKEPSVWRLCFYSGLEIRCMVFNRVDLRSHMQMKTL